jgi:hypothetical protein
MPSPPTLPDIRYNPDGSIEGIDGLLDQIAAAVAKRFIPILRHELLPVLQEDRGMQMRIGRGIGREIAMPLWAIAIGGALYGGIKLYERHRMDRKIESFVDRVMP